jgi:hypothetical protein
METAKGAVPWLQASTGAYMAFFLLVHVGAVLSGRLSLGLDTNFYFAAAGFHVPPFQYFFAPYYFLGVVALFTHLGCAAYWRKRSSGCTSSSLLVTVPVVLGTVISVVIVLALAGYLYPVRIPATYQAAFGQPR